MEKLLSMINKKCDIAIINRSFLPKNETIGGGLYEMARKLAKENKQVCILTQSNIDLNKYLNQQKIDSNIKVISKRPLSTRYFHLLARLIELLTFSLWITYKLCIIRPHRIYVSTDPPIIVPAIVAVFSTLFRRKYIYHLQDIHPEISRTIIGMPKWICRILNVVEKFTLRRASKIVTITASMAEAIYNKTNQFEQEIILLMNPTKKYNYKVVDRQPGFVFCGTMGRCQQIPLLLESIKSYVSQGGNLPFIFAGSGKFYKEVEKLSKMYSNITCHPWLPLRDAMKLIASYQYSIVSIDDKVTQFAFPSKTSSYITLKSNIIGICSKETSVAKWIEETGCGIQVNPNKNALVELFFAIEHNQVIYNDYQIDLSSFTIDSFSDKLASIIKVI